MILKFLNQQQKSMEELPKRCPICYDSHDMITYVGSSETNNTWVCKACYTQGDPKYFKLCFGKEPSAEELAELSVFRIRSLKNNLKEARRNLAWEKANNDVFAMTDADLVRTLQKIQREIEFRAQKSTDS